MPADWLTPQVCALPRVGSRVTDDAIDRLRQAGREVLDLHAHPRRALPAHVRQAAAEAAASGEVAPSRGLLSFRAAIAARLGSEFGRALDPEREVLVTAGAMQALDLVLGATLAAGDEVLTPAPCFFLDGLVAPRGARLVTVPCQGADGFAIDWDAVEHRVGPRTRLLLLITPGNPTGYVLSPADLDALAALAERRDLLVVSDESYDRLVYDGFRHLSPAAQPALAPRTAVIRSFTKSYAMPGWRVGYLIGPAPLIDGCLKLIEWSALYGSRVPQAAAEAALVGPQAWLADVAREFQALRDRAHRALSSCGLPTVLPRGGPFLFPNVSRSGTSERVAHSLLHDHGIPCVPGDTLRGEGHVRLAFGCSGATMDLLVERIDQAFAAVAATAAG